MDMLLQLLDFYRDFLTRMKGLYRNHPRCGGQERPFQPRPPSKLEVWIRPKYQIGQQRFAFLVQQNVSWFDVTVQNAVFMRVLYSARQIRDEFRCFSDRQRRTPDYFVKLTALDELSY